MKNYVIFIGICLIFFGCFTTKRHTPSTEQYYKQKIANLENQIKLLQEKIKALETKKEHTTNINEKVKILEELSSLSEKQQENIAYLEQIKKDIYEIKSNLDTKQIPKKSIPKNYKSYLKKYKNKTYTPKISRSESYYQSCYKLYEKGSFAKSEKCFKKFISKYSGSSLVSNAYFWIGETYYARKNYTKAIDYYDIILTKFIKSEKVAPALLKEGLAFYNLNDKEGAKIFFEKVISDYPNTPQAKYAQKYLIKYNLK